jgi:chromosome segregation ATPase
LLKKERDENAERFQKDSKYHDFLKSAVVLKGDSDPDNVEALMKRYENLEKYRNYLVEHIEKKKQELNDKRKKQKEDNENWKKNTIELNHIISTHAKTLERLQKENNKNRKRVESSQANINELQVTLGKIEMACKFLYQRVNDPHNGSRINRTQQNPDEYKMLKVVGDTISDLTYVLNQFKALSEQERQKVSKTTV